MNNENIILIEEKIKRERVHCKHRRDEGARRRDAIWCAGWDGKMQGLEMALAIIREVGK